MKILSSLSRDCLYASLYFAEAAGKLEHNGANAREHEAHRAYALGSIFSSVSFLEARFNEFCEGSFCRRSGVPKRTIDCLNKILQEGADRWGILQKYQIAIYLAGKDEILKKRRRAISVCKSTN